MLSLKKGERALFVCLSTRRPKWYLLDEESSSSRFITNNRTLRFESIRRHHRGIYRCVGWVNREYGKGRPFYADVLLRYVSKDSTELTLLQIRVTCVVVFVGEKNLITPPTRIAAKFSGHATMYCRCDRKVIWLFNGSILPLNVVTSYRNSSPKSFKNKLEVKNVQLENMGIYMCRVIGEDKSLVFEDEVFLYVAGKTSVT